jgi:hypothetical protein
MNIYSPSCGRAAMECKKTLHLTPYKCSHTSACHGNIYLWHPHLSEGTFQEHAAERHLISFILCWQWDVSSPVRAMKTEPLLGGYQSEFDCLGGDGGNTMV